MAMKTVTTLFQAFLQVCQSIIDIVHVGYIAGKFFTKRWQLQQETTETNRYPTGRNVSGAMKRSR